MHLFAARRVQMFLQCAQHSVCLCERRYKQTVDTILAFRDSKHANVKQQVMLLIPKMSEFAPEKFVLSYLEPCTTHLLSVLANKSHANSIAFQALGQMLLPLGATSSRRELQRRLQGRLPDIEKEMLDALVAKGPREQAKRSMCMEAITCIGVMAEARLSFCSWRCRGRHWRILRVPALLPHQACD